MAKSDRYDFIREYWALGVLYEIKSNSKNVVCGHRADFIVKKLLAWSLRSSLTLAIDSVIFCYQLKLYYPDLWCEMCQILGIIGLFLFHRQSTLEHCTWLPLIEQLRKVLFSILNVLMTCILIDDSVKETEIGFPRYGKLFQLTI